MLALCLKTNYPPFTCVYVVFQALQKAGQAKQVAKDAADKVADALAKVENISSILCKEEQKYHRSFTVVCFALGHVPVYCFTLMNGVASQPSPSIPLYGFTLMNGL